MNLSYVTQQLPHHQPFLHVVLYVLPCLVVILIADRWQDYAVARWDARKAARQARNRALCLERSEHVFLPDRPVGAAPAAPEALSPARRDHGALFRVRAAGRGVRVGRGR